MILATKGGILRPRPTTRVRGTCARRARRRCVACGVDVIDVYQIHRPDLLAHPGEVAEVLTELATPARCAEVGMSNHTVAQARALQA